MTIAQHRQHRQHRRRRLTRLLVAAAAAAALAGCLPPPFSGIGQSTLQLLPKPTASGGFWTTNVVAGSDGNLWYGAGLYLRRVTPDGALTQFPATGGCEPRYLAPGPDGALWMTTWPCAHQVIGRITTSGRLGWYQLPAPFDDMTDLGPITAGPDGNVWFAMGSSLGRITPAGRITIHPTGLHAGVTGLASGADGALWFTLDVGGSAPGIGRMSMSGAVRTIPATVGLDQPHALARGRDGTWWFATLDGKYGRLTPAGAVRLWPVPPSPTGRPATLRAATSAPDGSVWFAGDDDMALRVRPDGSAQHWLVAPDRQTGVMAGVNGIAYAANGSLWISTLGDETLGRISAAGALHSTIALRGRNGHLLVQHDLNGRWVDLGGSIVGPPSVLSIGGTNYYFVAAGDGHPWVRSDTLGWQRMSGAYPCELPVAAVKDEILTLVCGRRYFFNARMPALGALPTLTPAPLAVGYSQGPSWAIETPALLGGVDSGPEAWARTLPNGTPLTTYVGLAQPVDGEATALRCVHAPAARVSGDTLYLVCVGGGHRLQYVTSANGTGPWSAVHTVPVVTGTGRPGLVAVPDGSVLALLSNLDGSITESRLTLTGGTLQATLPADATAGVSADGS